MMHTEGYFDPTMSSAIERIEREDYQNREKKRAHACIRELRALANSRGYDIACSVRLKNKETGAVYR